jgi:predicted Mrr-cat superfamily restriction endonuclease
MREWLLRPYPHEKLRAQEFISQKIIAIGWPFTGSAAELSETKLRTLLEGQYPKWGPKRVSDGVNCLVVFTNQMSAGDLVLVVPKVSDFGGMVMLGQVTGEYAFDVSRANHAEGYPHQRSVRWLRPRISRAQLPESISAFMGHRGITLFEFPTKILSEHAREREWLE